MEPQLPHRSYLTAIFTFRCPRCREGYLFKYRLSFRLRRSTEMHGRCPICSQPTDIEVGFYYGTGYVSYLASILITVISFLIWLVVIGFSFHDRRFIYWITFNSVFLLVLQPWLMRFSRVLWLSFFIGYDPDWRWHKPDDPERVVEGEMNNW